MNKAIFFDRDGVLIEDVHLLTNKKNIIIPPMVIKAFKYLSCHDYIKIIITNQTVISRGLAMECEVNDINNFIIDKIIDETGVKIIKAYVCPHHPQATIAKYRINCECRKPKPGMLINASKDYDINLSESWMIGDRISDIIAGSKAGCKTILLRTGMHTSKPIISDAFDFSVIPDFICDDLFEAVQVIFKEDNI